nr:PilC/PilY family type IV pilus protein [uncultured Noviherbaspirillum sp.]
MFDDRITRWLQHAAAATCLLAAGVAQAALTDLANAPLASAGAKPNIMLVLDDSGSMQWSYLGDSVKTNGYANTVGYRNALCNTIYYNPVNTYLPPVGTDGLPVAPAAFDAAWLDGYRRTVNDARVDLGTEFRAWRSRNSDPDATSWDCWNRDGDCANPGVGDIGNAPGPAYYFVYKGQRRTRLGDGSSQDDCKDTAFDATPGGAANWTRVTIGPQSGPDGGDERQNFANWYSFYRTRILLMKTSLIRAVRELDASYRIGYSTIGYTGADTKDHAYLGIADFDAAQKESLYTKLSSLVVPASGTPLRGALSKTGRMYAGRLATGGSDPVQFSCQQNYTILSTDGYWNSNVGSGVDEGAGYGPLDVDGTPVGNADALLPRPQYDGTPAVAGTEGGAADTLADVAAYYYHTDLRRPGLGNCMNAVDTDVCDNNVPVSPEDPASHQHMTTFTLGLGVSGTLRYDPGYASAQSGPFADIRNGVADWPPPVEFGPARVDDLWHAAVNGGGYYFSAADSAALATMLSNALTRVRSGLGAAAAVATSRLEPIAGDNQVFLASYRNVAWDGELEARSIDPATGQVSATALWSAQTRLRSQAESGDRTILTDSGAGQEDSRLKPFTWEALSADERPLFGDLCTPAAKLSQCANFSADQRAAIDGEKLLAYLRGSSRDAGGVSALFRERERVLGDIVNAQPLYVAAPPFNYADTGYLAFQAKASSRQRMVYAAANDGMLHAFRASGADAGSEAWAYVPALMLPELYRLADRNHAALHRYLLDASPVAGDICPKAPPASCDAGEWRTILVGGYGAGGRGYYALDITDPAAPRSLWQYTVANDADLGLSFGNPVIAKRGDGTWVVALASGYNNVSPGDGGGYLTVLEAATGVRLQKIATGAGSADTPSGLARISAWVDSPSDNTAARIYGGDLLGNVWRFDIDNGSAVRLAQLGQSGGVGTPQPVTTRPELAVVRRGGATYPLVVVGTGSYLGTSDVASTAQQSLYVLKDSLQAEGLGQVRREGALVRQVLTTQEGGRGMTTQPVDWASGAGWYVDLDPGGASPGERIHVDMQVELGVLKAVGNVPSAAVCSRGGSSWLYALDLATGGVAPGAATAGILASDRALLTGVSTLKLASGNTITLAADSAGRVGSYADPALPAASRKVTRTNWREVTD